MRLLFRALLLILPAFPPARATTWNVPGDVATIQAAVDSAAAGDTVLVACGTYPEHDIVLSREITIRSATGTPDCVTVDAQGLGRVFVSELVDGDARLEGLTVTGGTAPAATGSDGWGGGIFFLGGSPMLVRCDFTGNDATVGGALALTGHGNPLVDGCTFHDNAADDGGALLVLTATTTLTGCTFRANAADSLGGAVFASLSVVTIETSTFHGNSAPGGGGALCGELYTDFLVDRTILSSSSAGEAVAGDSTTVATCTCTDVHGNAGGDWVGVLAGQDGVDGNFSADPRFCDADGSDFRLLPSSPCLPGNHPDGASCGTIGAHGECTVSGARSARLSAMPLRVWPNPARGPVRISWDLPRRGASRIAIYDVGGRRLRAFEVTAASGTLRWDGRTATGRPVAAGTYFVRLDGRLPGETRRILLLR